MGNTDRCRDCGDYEICCRCGMEPKETVETKLRRELLTLSETLSATTIMATARRLRELGEGA